MNGMESKIIIQPSRLPPANANVRWMIRRDYPEVLAIEAASFEYAWNDADFLRVNRNRNVVSQVAEVHDVVIGFMTYELHKTRLALVNLAVAPAWRGRGVGRQLVYKLLSKLAVTGRTRLTACTRETNLPAQKFFRALGLRAERVLRAYYEDSGESAYRFEYRLPDVAPVEDTEDE